MREEHGFKGYIHLKSIPDADPALIAEAGRYADRLSINVELPTETGLKTFAPEKRAASIKTTMANLRDRIAESQADRRAPRFSPAGQGTQMIVGADGANDAQIVATVHRFTRATISSASTIRPSVRSRIRAVCCR